MKHALSFHFACVIISLFSGLPLAHADYVPGRERPTLRAEMQVTQSRVDFQGVRSVTLSLTRIEGSDSPHPTGMTVEYMVPNRIAASTVGIEVMRNISYNLRIIHRETDACGSVHYQAQLPALDEDTLNHQLPLSQVYVYLVDHSESDPECQSPIRTRATWEASVRQSSGQRGFLNSSMFLVGQPEPLMVTQ